MVPKISLPANYLNDLLYFPHQLYEKVDLIVASKSFYSEFSHCILSAYILTNICIYVFLKYWDISYYLPFASHAFNNPNILTI